MDKVAKVQASLLEMSIGGTGARFGVVVTRWGKDSFEVGTFAKGPFVGSETAAEDVLKEIEK